MPRLLPLASALVCVALASLVACNNDAGPAKRILGTWVVDTDALRVPVPDNIPPKQQQMAKYLATLLPIVAQVRLIVTADEVAITNPGGKTDVSTYQVEKIEGDTVTIAWTRNLQADLSLHMTMTVTGDRATLVTSADPTKPTPMMRLAAAAPDSPATPAPAPAQP